LPDFRTKDDSPNAGASLNLLDTILDMQRRQEWMRDRLIKQGHEPLPDAPRP
jgi:hypothetical protein